MAQSPHPLRFQLDSSLSGASTSHYYSIPTSGRAGTTTHMPMPPSHSHLKLNSSMKAPSRIARNQSCTPRPHQLKNLAKERAIIEAEYQSNTRPARLDMLDFEVNESIPKSTVFSSERRNIKLPLKYRQLSPQFAKFQAKLNDPIKEDGISAAETALLQNCKNKFKAVKKENVNPEKGLNKYRAAQSSYCLSESPLKMRGGNRQQTNLILHHKYIRKAPHRKHSVLSMNKAHHSCINSHRKSEHSKSRFDNSLEQEILSITAPVADTPQNIQHNTSQTVSLLSSQKLTFKAGMTPKRKNIMMNGSGIEGIREEELKMLNEARSKDLKIRTNPEQERRFYEYCRKNIRGRKLCLRELGLGLEGSRVLSSILKSNDHFARLDLSKNNIGDAGLKSLINGLRQNASLVHIDLGSNNLTAESCIPFFQMLKTHDAITSVVLSNSEGMHRNKIGERGCRAIAEVIRENKIITLLDVSDNALGHEGINTICEALSSHSAKQPAPSLLTLNISHNAVKRESIPLIKAAIVKSPHLMELNLSDSKLNDRSLEELAVVFYNNTTKLETLDLSYNHSLTSQGILLFFQALRSNTCLHTLNLQNNNFGSTSFKQISTHLRMNKGLSYLNLSYCNIKKEHCNGLAEGLGENKTLRTLLLDHNPIMNEGAKAISRALKKNKALFHIDLSVCDIGEEAVDEIVLALGCNTTLQSLILRDNKLCGDSGEKLCSAILRNKTLTKVVLEKNSVKQKHLNEIGVALQRNRDLLKNAQIPKIRKHLNDMKQDTLFDDLSSAHKKIKQEMRRINAHQKEVEKEIQKEQEKYEKIMEETPVGDQENGEIEGLELEVNELDKEICSLNQAFKVKNLEKKKELAAIKFKISNGIDSEAIVRKKLSQTRREIDSHQDKTKQLARLKAELDEQLREESMMKIIYDNYEKEVNRRLRERDIKLSFKERPQSAESPSRSPRKSPSGSPKNRRLFGVGNINSQNVYFKEALPEIENVKTKKKGKEVMTPVRATPKIQGLLANKRMLQKIPEFGGDQKKQLKVASDESSALL